MRRKPKNQQLYELAESIFRFNSRGTHPASLDADIEYAWTRAKAFVTSDLNPDNDDQDYSDIKIEPADDSGGEAFTWTELGDGSKVAVFESDIEPLGRVLDALKQHLANR